MCDAIKDYTPSGKIKRPSYSLVANWVKESWDSMDINMIRNSFKCCGISNDMNGSEDNLIFDFNQSNKENLKVEEDNEGDNGDNNENDSEDDNEDSDNEESDGNELENNYYRENEEQNVIHDW
jgi:hypothetical protein